MTLTADKYVTRFPQVCTALNIPNHVVEQPRQKPRDIVTNGVTRTEWYDNPDYVHLDSLGDFMSGVYGNCHDLDYCPKSIMVDKKNTHDTI
jgi:hypothetical protein